MVRTSAYIFIDETNVDRGSWGKVLEEREVSHKTYVYKLILNMGVIPYK